MMSLIKRTSRERQRVKDTVFGWASWQRAFDEIIVFLSLVERLDIAFCRLNLTESTITKINSYDDNSYFFVKRKKNFSLEKFPYLPVWEFRWSFIFPWIFFSFGQSADFDYANSICTGKTDNLFPGLRVSFARGLEYFADRRTLVPPCLSLHFTREAFDSSGNLIKGRWV